jgi:hypothetical protein
MWLKLATIDRFSNFFGYFHIFQVVEHIPDSFRTNTVKNRLFQKSRKKLSIKLICACTFGLTSPALSMMWPGTYYVTVKSRWSIVKNISLAVAKCLYNKVGFRCGFIVLSAGVQYAPSRVAKLNLYLKTFPPPLFHKQDWKSFQSLPASIILVYCIGSNMG